MSSGAVGTGGTFVPFSLRGKRDQPPRGALRSPSDPPRLCVCSWRSTNERDGSYIGGCTLYRTRATRQSQLVARSGPCARGYFCRPAAKHFWGISDPKQTPTVSGSGICPISSMPPIPAGRQHQPGKPSFLRFSAIRSSTGAEKTIACLNLETVRSG
jgi:hypothetical protein